MFKTKLGIFLKLIPNQRVFLYQSELYDIPKHFIILQNFILQSVAFLEFLALFQIFADFKLATFRW